MMEFTRDYMTYYLLSFCKTYDERDKEEERLTGADRRSTGSGVHHRIQRAERRISQSAALRRQYPLTSILTFKTTNNSELSRRKIP